MPQKKRKSAEEILGVQPPAGGRKSAEEILGISAPAQPATDAPGFLENLALGAKQGAIDYIVEPAMTLSEAVGRATAGDIKPLMQIAELAGAGIIKLSAGAGPSPLAFPEQTQEITQAADKMIADVKAEQSARQANQPGFTRTKAAKQRIAERAAQDPSLSGKITRGVAGGVVAAVPAVVAGVASGGSVPAIAATTALQSAAQPENLALNVGLSVAPVPAIAPIIRRIRGARGGATPTAQPSTAAAQVRAMGAVDDLAEGAARQTGRQTPEALLGIPESAIELTAARGGKVSAAVGPGIEADLALNAGATVAPAEKTSILEIITAVRKAGLLTGVKTHLRNIAGTGVFQLSEEAARLPASVIDATIGAITKRRTISGPSLTAMGRSAYDAATKGIREAGNIIRNGISETDLARLQLDREIKSGSKILDAYVNGTFRLLNAEDVVIRTYAYRRAIEDRIVSLARTEVKQGRLAPGKLSERVRELRNATPEDMVAEAIADAEVAVFTNNNLVSQALGKAKDELAKTPGGKWVNFATDTVMPFTKTPTNIIARMLEYSPLGFGKNAYQAAGAITKQAFTDAEQRAFAQTFGRASIGSALIALGWKLGEAGLLTGLYEDEASKRSRDMAAGRTPGAIRIGDTWRQVTGFAPLGNVLAIGASLAREYGQERADESQTSAKMAGVAFNAVAEQPLLEAAKSLAQPGPASETAGKLAGSFIPTMVSDVAELIDPQQRDARGQGFTAQIAKRTPFARQSLPPAVDALGKPLEDRASQMIDPTRGTTAREGPLMLELLRLDIGLGKLQKKPKENDTAYRQRLTRFGDLYEAFAAELLTNAQYRRANDAVRRKALDSLAQRVKAQLNEETTKGRKAPDPRFRLNAGTLMDAVLKAARQNPN